jgi:hypothetical protein
MGIKFPITKNLKELALEIELRGLEKNEESTTFGRTTKVSLDFNAMLDMVCFSAN